MFDMFRNRPVPTGPIPFDFDVLIERPVSEVYPLVDWADPGNAKRQLGHAVEGQSPNFVLKIASMPEHRFALDVTEEKKDEAYAFACDIQPRSGGSYPVMNATVSRRWTRDTACSAWSTRSYSLME